MSHFIRCGLICEEEVEGKRRKKQLSQFYETKKQLYDLYIRMEELSWLILLIVRNFHVL